MPMVMLMGRVGGTAMVIKSNPLLTNVRKSMVLDNFKVSNK